MAKSSAKEKTKKTVQKASAPKRRSKKNTPKEIVIPHETIQYRAYLIWEAEGRPQGRDTENWEKARKEILKELSV